MGHKSWLQNNVMRTGYGLAAIFGLLVWMNDQSPEAVEQRQELRSMLRRGWSWAQKHLGDEASTRQK